MAVFEGKKSSNDIIINDTMSEDVVASDKPPRYLFLGEKVLYPYLNSHSGPDAPKLVQYNFRLMDEYKEWYFYAYLDWIRSRGASLKDDILDVVNDAILITKLLQEEVCR